MNCRKCKSKVHAPIFKTIKMNHREIRIATCPSCGANLKDSKKLFIGLSILALSAWLVSTFWPSIHLP